MLCCADDCGSRRKKLPQKLIQYFPSLREKRKKGISSNAGRICKHFFLAGGAVDVLLVFFLVILLASFCLSRTSGWLVHQCDSADPFPLDRQRPSVCWLWCLFAPVVDFYQFTPWRLCQFSFGTKQEKRSCAVYCGERLVVAEETNRWTSLLLVSTKSPLFSFLHVSA